ncbi:MAG: LysR family transcriptional regulator [Betaproteobacteria bacterium]|nr:LysR family transcriptional regulator [Betaproteobacteria bacterium]
MKAGVNLDRIAAFVAVADAGSFTAAADRLDTTKSALSQAVARLEKELGATLLQRSTRKLAITEAGAAFLADCRALLAQADAALERARSERARPSGTLRLTSPMESIPLVAGWIAEYRERFPAMRVDYLPTDLRMDLIAGQVDLAIRIGLMRDSSLHGVTLGELELWLAASPAYLARRGTPRTPDELARHEWVSLSVVPTPWTCEFTRRDGSKQRVRMNGALSSNSSAAVRGLVLAGAGIASFPDSTIRADLEAGRLVRLLPQARLTRLHLYAAYPGSPPPAKTRAFIDLVREHTRSNERRAVASKRAGAKPAR